MLLSIDRWNPETGLKTWFQTTSIQKGMKEGSGSKKEKKTGKSQGKGKKPLPPPTGDMNSGSDDDDDDEDGVGAPVPKPLVKVTETYQLVVSLARDERYRNAFRPLEEASKISPMEMIGIPLLVYAVHISRVPTSTEPNMPPVTPAAMERTSRLIILMRKHLHATYPNTVRMNSNVGKTMADYCLESAISG
ncbi:hypothetical protein V5O48_014895 [Marasmius crinis-equi]|uniref:Uncharacterized protein n=1 Tax=Marasmius crinis-equi TaxID=585013 RepID=A0ABR3EW03_9AGAR